MLFQWCACNLPILHKPVLFFRIPFAACRPLPPRLLIVSEADTEQVFSVLFKQSFGPLLTRLKIKADFMATSDKNAKSRFTGSKRSSGLVSSIFCQSHYQLHSITKLIQFNTLANIQCQCQTLNGRQGEAQSET